MNPKTCAPLSVAPMMDWTDRHCRYLHRLISKKALLYTEMVNSGAILHGHRGKHLDFDALEHPLVLQLGGNDPGDLAQCAKVAEQWGYDQVNLNCGCPSERVQRGAFGACLMLHPQEVSACVKAMREASDLPVSVKHRIGIDGHEDYEFVRDFVGVVSEAGCQTFIVHARIAVLSGLSPKENREIPPLKYDVVDRLKRDFPELNFVLNGGIQTHEQVMSLLDRFDGVMLGRAAYHQPWLLSHWDACWNQTGSAQSLTGFESLDADDFAARKAVELQYVQYMQRQMRDLDLHWSVMSRHMLGLYHGLAGARRWRQVWSSVQHRPLEPLEVMSLAHEAMAQSKASTLTCTAFEQ